MHYSTLSVFMKIPCQSMALTLIFWGKKWIDPKFVNSSLKVLCGIKSTHLLKNLQQKSDVLCHSKKLQLCWCVLNCFFLYRSIFCASTYIASVCKGLLESLMFYFADLLDVEASVIKISDTKIGSVASFVKNLTKL